MSSHKLFLALILSIYFLIPNISEGAFPTSNKQNLPLNSRHEPMELKEILRNGAMDVPKEDSEFFTRSYRSILASQGEVILLEDAILEAQKIGMEHAHINDQFIPLHFAMEKLEDLRGEVIEKRLNLEKTFSDRPGTLISQELSYLYAMVTKILNQEISDLVQERLSFKAHLLIKGLNPEKPSQLNEQDRASLKKQEKESQELRTQILLTGETILFLSSSYGFAQKGFSAEPPAIYGSEINALQLLDLIKHHFNKVLLKADFAYFQSIDRVVVKNAPSWPFIFGYYLFARRKGIVDSDSILSPRDFKRLFHLEFEYNQPRGGHSWRASKEDELLPLNANFRLKDLLSTIKDLLFDGGFSKATEFSKEFGWSQYDRLKPQNGVEEAYFLHQIIQGLPIDHNLTLEEMSQITRVSLENENSHFENPSNELPKEPSKDLFRLVEVKKGHYKILPNNCAALF